MENNINIALIESFIKENNLTYFDFCKICQIAKSDLEHIFNGSLDFDVIILFKIAKKLKINIHELFTC